MWKSGGYFFLFVTSIIEILGESDKQGHKHQQFYQCDVHSYHLPSKFEGRKRKISLPSQKGSNRHRMVLFGYTRYHKYYTIFDILSQGKKLVLGTNHQKARYWNDISQYLYPLYRSIPYPVVREAFRC